MLVWVLAISLAVALLRGGQICRLATLTLRGWSCYLLSGALQLLVACGNRSSSADGVWYMLSLLVLLAGAWMDRRLPGMRCLLAGLALNGIVIAANRGMMPVLLSSDLWKSNIQAINHVPMAESTRLRVLGDIVPVPIGGRHFVLMSIGDIAIGVGIFILIQEVLLSPTRSGSR